MRAARHKQWKTGREREAKEPPHVDSNNQPIRPLKYQKLGKSHFLVGFFGDSEDGDNCTGWCLEKLAVAGIGDGTGKPKPAKQAGQCLIL